MLSSDIHANPSGIDAATTTTPALPVGHSPTAGHGPAAGRLRQPSALLDGVAAIQPPSLENLPVKLQQKIFGQLPCQDRVALRHTSSTLRQAWDAADEVALQTGQRKAENAQLLHAAIDMDAVSRFLRAAGQLPEGHPLVAQAAEEAIVSIERAIERDQRAWMIPRLIQDVLAQARRTDAITRLGLYEKIGLDLLPRCGKAVFQLASMEDTERERAAALSALQALAVSLTADLDDAGLQHNPQDLQQLQPSPAAIQSSLRAFADDMAFWNRDA